MLYLRFFYLLKMLVFIFFFSDLKASEIVLNCKLTSGISGEQDETDVEFKNMVDIDESQILYLDIENNWLFNLPFSEYKKNKIKFSEMNTSINDFSVFTFAQLEKDKVLINKHVIELNRYSGFLKYNFETTYEKIYRTGYCEIAKKKMF